jgi:hypothetical protein
MERAKMEVGRVKAAITKAAKVDVVGVNTVHERGTG